jgi:hypothetical protein
VKPTGLLVVTAPALSVARAVRTWLPDGTFLHVKAYGAVFPEAPTMHTLIGGVPSRPDIRWAIPLVDDHFHRTLQCTTGAGRPPIQTDDVPRPLAA